MSDVCVSSSAPPRGMTEGMGQRNSLIGLAMRPGRPAQRYGLYPLNELYDEPVGVAILDVALSPGFGFRCRHDLDASSGQPIRCIGCYRRPTGIRMRSGMICMAM